MTINYSVCFLAYNEEFAIPNLIIETHEFFKKIGEENFEILIIDDSSTDETKKQVQLLKKNFSQLELVSHEKNMGYSLATKSALSNATGEWIFILDGDGQHPPSQLSHFMPLCTDENDLILPQRTYRAEPLSRLFASFVLVLLSRIFIGFIHRDINGGIKAIRKKNREHLTIEYEINLVNPELWVRAKVSKLNIAFVNVEQLARLDGTKSRVISSPISMFFKTVAYLTYLRRIISHEKLVT